MGMRVKHRHFFKGWARSGGQGGDGRGGGQGWVCSSPITLGSVE